MDGWMDGWMEEMMGGCVGGWVDRWMDNLECTNTHPHPIRSFHFPSTLKRSIDSAESVMLAQQAVKDTKLEVQSFALSVPFQITRQLP